MSERHNIKNELKELNSALSGQAPRMPYPVPEGYFEGLAGQVLTRIKQEEGEQELNTLSPLLSSLSRRAPYSVSDGYFQNPVAIPAKKPALSVPMFQRSWIRYAVAAAAILTGVFVWFGRDRQSATPATAQAVIVEYKKDIQKLNDKEQSLLQEFVEAGMTGQETAQVDDNQAFNTSGLLTDVSEQELNEFIEQSAFINDTETNE